MQITDGTFNWIVTSPYSQICRIKLIAHDKVDNADTCYSEVFSICDPTVDTDCDFLLNGYDNCPDKYNPNQADADNDGVGDICDNCPNTANPDQANEDGDNWGNVCDDCPSVSEITQRDSDNDGFGDLCDNCPYTVNANQSNRDNDQWGDICDNCPDDSTGNQNDHDGDGIGDACDPDWGCQGPPVAILHVDTLECYYPLCVRLDGIESSYFANFGQSGYMLYFGDGDSIAALYSSHVYPFYGSYEAKLIIWDSCGTDTATQWLLVKCPGDDPDNDGWGVDCDNCPNKPNEYQIDSDSDGVGDACDYICGDANGDGLVNVGDAAYIISYVFKGGPAPIPYIAGDVNCDEITNVGDAVYLNLYIFRGGSEPCADCPQ